MWVYSWYRRDGGVVFEKEGGILEGRNDTEATPKKTRQIRANPRAAIATWWLRCTEHPVVTRRQGGCKRARATWASYPRHLLSKTAGHVPATREFKSLLEMNLYSSSPCPFCAAMNSGVDPVSFALFTSIFMSHNMPMALPILLDPLLECSLKVARSLALAGT